MRPPFRLGIKTPESAELKSLKISRRRAMIMSPCFNQRERVTQHFDQALCVKSSHVWVVPQSVACQRIPTLLRALA